MRYTLIFLYLFLESRYQEENFIFLNDLFTNMSSIERKLYFILSCRFFIHHFRSSCSYIYEYFFEKLQSLGCIRSILCRFYIFCEIKRSLLSKTKRNNFLMLIYIISNHFLEICFFIMRHCYSWGIWKQKKNPQKRYTFLGFRGLGTVPPKFPFFAEAPKDKPPDFHGEKTLHSVSLPSHGRHPELIRKRKLP